jgi:hypothetical protein
MLYLVLFKIRDAFQAIGVPDSSPSIIVVLLITIAGLLVVIAGLLVAVLRRLSGGRATQTSELPSPMAETSDLEVGEIPSGSAFECFLNEDPTRRLLPKKEQSAAYRIWRKEKGLNWTASTGS